MTTTTTTEQFPSLVFDTSFLTDPHKFDPFFIGHHRLFERFAGTKMNATNYPPYNIIQDDDETYIIEVALAGWDIKNLDVVRKEGVLFINGTQQEERESSKFMHKGISARSFTRQFTLLDTVEVQSVEFGNGILRILLKNIIPESKKPKTYPIADTTTPRKVSSGDKTLLVE